MRKSISGQTSLILILLTAAALIFYAITLNWGSIAQTKALVTVAADQAASLLASDVASYGEMEKITYLNNHNRISSIGGILMAIIAVVVAIICLIITITTAGGGSAIWAVFAVVLAVAAVVVAVVNLVLQICVVQPGITRLWNKLQVDQPIQQQFYEGGIAAALEGSVTDQVNITDYFDLNTNGIYGINWNNGMPLDSVGRFAFFYTDRLKMLNWADEKNSGQVAFFASQLGEFLNGETCGQNVSDHSSYPGVPLNPYCSPTNFAGLDCVNDPTDPACQAVIPPPTGFQLTDACAANSTAASATYTPYCDPCCQPPIVQDPTYCDPKSGNCSPNPLHPTPFKLLGPSRCYPQYPQPLPSDCNPSNPTANPNAPDCYPLNGECTTNNPYGSSFPYIYDPTYQNYTRGLSFLAQFGRDRQAPLGGEPPFTTLTTQGAFPNGVYPFFWLMKDYSPQVNTITPASLQASQVHWCVASNGTNGVKNPSTITGYTPLTPATLTAFPELNQLSLAYTCSGQNCCVGYLADAVSGSVVLATSPTIAITVTGQPAPTISDITITPPAPIQAGETVTLSVTASEPSPGSIASVNFNVNGVVADYTVTNAGNIYSATVTATSTVGTSYTVFATATDSYGVSVNSPTTTVTITAVPTGT